MERIALAISLAADPLLWVYVFVLGFPVRAMTRNGERIVRCFASVIICGIAGVTYSGITETLLAQESLDHALDLEVFVTRTVLAGSILLAWSLLLSQALRAREN